MFVQFFCFYCLISSIIYWIFLILSRINFSLYWFLFHIYFWSYSFILLSFLISSVFSFNGWIWSSIKGLYCKSTSYQRSYPITSLLISTFVEIQRFTFIFEDLCCVWTSRLAVVLLASVTFFYDEKLTVFIIVSPLNVNLLFILLLLELSLESLI